MPFTRRIDASSRHLRMPQASNDGRCCDGLLARQHYGHPRIVKPTIERHRAEVERNANLRVRRAQAKVAQIEAELDLVAAQANENRRIRHNKEVLEELIEDMLLRLTGRAKYIAAKKLDGEYVFAQRYDYQNPIIVEPEVYKALEIFTWAPVDTLDDENLVRTFREYREFREEK